QSMTGVDLADSAVAYSHRKHGRSGLRFVSGDAEQLPFPDASFDAVVNVESSHCYPQASRFFEEVVRVLRPGGVFLFADMRWNRVDGADDGSALTGVARLRAELAAAGLVVVEEEDITDNVLRALELDSPRRRALIQATAPGVIRSRLHDFAGIEGST